MTDETAPRLYLVTPEHLDPAGFAETLSGVLAAVPVACLRLDLGAATEEDWRAAANHLLPVCHEADVPLVVADHPRLVAPLGLDGVHLGPRGGNIRSLRKELGSDRIIGAWAGASKHQGMVLAEAGADYVTLGPVGDTGDLGDGSRAGPELFQWWAEMIETPVVAEGAMGPAETETLAPITDFVVPDRTIWDHSDPIEALTTLARLLD